jgi:nicotinamide/nicotinate riboside kinase
MIGTSNKYPPRIPYTTTPTGKTVQDWDTSAAIDTSFLAQALSYVRANGHLPPRLQSKEDQNEDAGPCVPDTLVTELRREVESRLASAQTVQTSTLVFMEGFLLYAPPEGYEYKNKSKDGGASVFVGDEHYPTDHGVLRPVHQQIGLPLFLPAAYATVKARREGRSGYVTIGPAPEPPVTTTTTTTAVSEMEKKQNEEIDLEGEDDRPPQNFWTDPPGYVDDIVWPRYVRDHAWLLVDGDGDGEGEEEGDIVQRVGQGVEVRGDVGVNVAPGKGSVGMEVVLRWAVEEVIAFYLEEKK